MLRRGTTLSSRPLSQLGQAGAALLALVAALAIVLHARSASADQPGPGAVPVAVLAFDSDDAEDQADAITGALRSRVRASQGWSLIETTQSLGMLTAAFKCPARPTPECQQKIGEQIHAERYIYGFVSKGPAVGMVTAEIHLFQKGKPESPAVKEQYADNLKDPNDDTLRKIATRIVERFGGTAVGTVVVRSSDASGDVIVDGAKHVPLEKGSAHIELSAGSHSIEVAPTGGPSSKRNVNVTAGQQIVLEFTGGSTIEPPPPESKLNTRKIIGGASMGVGAVLGIIAIVEVIHYASLQSDGTDRAAQLDKNDPVNGSKPCREYDAKCASINNDSKTASGLAIGLGAGAAAAIGVGAYLFFTDPSGTEKTATRKTRLIPTVGAGSGSLTVIGSF